MGEGLMVVLDSDILIATLRGDQKASTYVTELVRDARPMFTTTVNVYELQLGAYLHHRSEEKLAEVERLLSSLTILSFTLPASQIAARISKKLVRSGQTVNFQDIAIASIALAYRESVATRNVKDFSRFPELKVVQW